LDAVRAEVHVKVRSVLKRRPPFGSLPRRTGSPKRVQCGSSPRPSINNLPLSILARLPSMEDSRRYMSPVAWRCDYSSRSTTNDAIHHDAKDNGTELPWQLLFNPSRKGTKSSDYRHWTMRYHPDRRRCSKTVIDAQCMDVGDGGICNGLLPVE